MQPRRRSVRFELARLVIIVATPLAADGRLPALRHRAPRRAACRRASDARWLVTTADPARAGDVESSRTALESLATRPMIRAWTRALRPELADLREIYGGR